MDKEKFKGVFIQKKTQEYNKLKKYAKIGKQLTSNNAEQYKSTSLGWRLHAMAVAYAPKVRLQTLSKIMALVTAGSLENLDVDKEQLSQVGNINPLEATLINIMTDLGTDIVMLMSDELKHKDLTLICNKGEDSSNAASFVKLLCWYYKKVKRDTVLRNQKCRQHV